MAKVCPMNGCRAKPGLCIHDKMMIVMGLLGAAGALGHWGLGWF